MWKLGLRPRNSFSGNTYIQISLQCDIVTDFILQTGVDFNSRFRWLTLCTGANSWNKNSFCNFIGGFPFNLYLWNCTVHVLLSTYSFLLIDAQKLLLAAQISIFHFYWLLTSKPIHMCALCSSKPINFTFLLAEYTFNMKQDCIKSFWQSFCKDF